MATTVVSGRVDTPTSQQAMRVIKAAGLTPAALIKSIWESIAQTGRLPNLANEDERALQKRDTFAEFLAFSNALPPCVSSSTVPTTPSSSTVRQDRTALAASYSSSTHCLVFPRKASSATGRPPPSPSTTRNILTNHISINSSRSLTSIPARPCGSASNNMSFRLASPPRTSPRFGIPFWRNNSAYRSGG